MLLDMASSPSVGGKPWIIAPATLDIDRHLIAFLVCGLLTLITLLSSFVGVARHLRHSGKKGICIYTVRILLMAPSYSFPSFLALVGRLTELNLILELCRKFYEAIVIFAFTQLLVAQLGGFERLGDHLSDDDCVHLPPLRWVFDRYSWTPSTRFVRRSLSSVLQYAAVTIIVIPLSLLSALLSEALFQKVFVPFSTAAIGASQMLAMYGLIIFYHANQDRLAPIRPVQKLLSIKLLVIATIWQKMIIQGLARFTSIFEHLSDTSVTNWSSDQIAEGTINCLIIVEMFFLSSYHHIVFPPGEDLSVSLAPDARTAEAAHASHGAARAPTAAHLSSETELSEAASSAPSSFTTSSGEVTVSLADAEADAAPEVGQIPTMRRLQIWVGSDHWGSHVVGEQTQLVGCWHQNCPTVRRFYHVFDITDVWKFYAELRRNYRTQSSDNLDASTAGRYARNFFAGHHDLRRADGLRAATTPLARAPS